MSLSLLERTVLKNKWIPYLPTAKQAVFLTAPQLEVFLGGAAFGGKSIGLLMAALQYVHVADYAALILRRSYADLIKPDALMDLAHQWLDGTEAHWSQQSYTWAFPTGATLSFGYLEHEKDKYHFQSAQYQFCAFDELSQFSESQYLYLFSRLRRRKDQMIPLRMRSASNPGGEGHEWVKLRFILNPYSQDRLFVPARLEDNPHADQAAYEKSLDLLDPVTQRQLRWGDWDAVQEGAIAQRSWFHIVEAAPADAERCRYWDFAATVKSASSPDPDYTVGALVAAKAGTFWVEHIVRGRWGPGDVESVVYNTAQADGKGVRVRFEQEPGSAGKIFTQRMIRELNGFRVDAVPVSGDKVARAHPFFSQCQGGNVFLVSGGWCSSFLDEICSFPVGSHDDIVDSVTGAWEAVGPARGVLLR